MARLELEGARRHTENELFRFGQEKSNLMAAEAREGTAFAQYIRIRLSGLPADNELAVEATKRREQIHNDIKDAAAAVEEVKQSLEQAKAEEKRLRALSLHYQGRSDTFTQHEYAVLVTDSDDEEDQTE